MKKIIYSVIAILCFGVTMVNAQNNRTNLTYAVGFATGDLGDYISQPSWRGFNIEVLKMVSEKVGVGGSFSWNVFYEAKDYDTYVRGTASLSGKQYRYSNNMPMSLNVNYYLTAGQKVIPYVGLGTGVMYTRRNTDMNIYTIEQEAWNFLLQPQVGIEISNEYSSAFTIAAKYFYGFAAQDFDKAQSYISLNVGWTFKS
jgi:outer membrane protein